MLLPSNERGHTIASQCDLTPFAPLFATSSSVFNSPHNPLFTNLSIASMNFFSSEADQVFLGDVVTMADDFLGFLDLMGDWDPDWESESEVADGRLGGIPVFWS